MDVAVERELLMPNTSQSGASAIIIAASMLLLLGMTAIALDLGAGFNERRQDQTATDTAAVAGALSFNDQSALASAVLDVAFENVPTAFTPQEWRGIWQSCVDSGRTAGFLPVSEPDQWSDGSAGSGTLDCISATPSKLRVRLPDQIYETAFGSVLGVDQLTTNAYTIVSILPEYGVTGLIPFAVEGGVAAGEICLDAGTGTLIPPCDGNEAGSFGNIAPPQYGNEELGTDPACKNQTAANNNYVPPAIAMGIDHFVWNFSATAWNDSNWSPTADTSENDVLNNADTHVDICTLDQASGDAVPSDGLPLNTVVVDTGNSVKADVTEGLVSSTVFPDGKKGRLWRTSGTTDTINSGADQWILDDTPLWTYLRAPGDQTGDKISSCGSSVKSDDDLRKCLSDYQLALDDTTDGITPGIIFKDSILSSPRFGFAPQLWHSNLGNGIAYRPVRTFRAVYVAGIWFKGNGQVLIEWYPNGTPESICQDKNGDCNPLVVEQVTAFLLPEESISDYVRDSYPGNDISAITVTIIE